MERTTHITKTLKELGISPKLLGYKYLTDAITMVMDNKTLVRRRVTKELYPTVAKKNNTSMSRVERAIRHSIDTSYNRGNIDLLNKIFGYSISPTKGKATNTEFIATIAEYVKENYGG